jgi:hypothetical protein
VSPIEFVFKLVLSAWPFVKEMVLEGKSLGYAFKNNTRRAVFSVVIMASFAFNVVNIGADLRVFSIVGKYVKLDKAYKTSEAQNVKLKAQLQNDCNVVPSPSPVPTPAAAEVVSPSDSSPATLDNYQALKNTFSGLLTAGR